MSHAKWDGGHRQTIRYWKPKAHRARSPRSPPPTSIGFDLQPTLKEKIMVQFIPRHLILFRDVGQQQAGRSHLTGGNRWVHSIMLQTAVEVLMIQVGTSTHN